MSSQWIQPEKNNPENLIPVIAIVETKNTSSDFMLVVFVKKHTIDIDCNYYKDHLLEYDSYNGGYYVPEGYYKYVKEGDYVPLPYSKRVTLWSPIPKL